MMNRIVSLLAFGFLAVFIGILVWEVPEIDLILVAALTVVLVAYDMATSSGKPHD